MKNNFRIGTGFDIHKFSAKRPLMLGGVNIPGEKGLLGHSDGDALLHAICDAILGALGAGDIGEHFPDVDPRYKGAASSIFLRKARQVMEKKGYTIGNIDCNVITERPKIIKYREAIVKSVSDILGISKDQVSVKGRTAEKMGAIGKGEALMVQAVVLLVRK
ncbi:MAG TPA: 2-C-methyl-D-erythritol 2,4-cyclodiphosphate synthase [Candidatus Omnitrophota bacterium]|nr:2-C-methyl-D-erythritol 2,4-cyclodiphosphate synthase [Candidatus Omnitrophota bacterium]HPS20424.1 2-C-methyl-D-erythritol 2,4-cyclodiphosphate synthase [Candidatus Omnitrophota bacterium]